ncbi:molybdopterin-dependent oxidoreductase [Chloroflexota bacterium]
MSGLTETFKTICGFCHTNCGMLIETRDGVIERIRGNREHPQNKGFLCPKGLAAKEFVYSPDRLKYPLMKTSSGFKRISWDEALDTVANRLKGIKESYGAESLVWCNGAPVTTPVLHGFIQLISAYGSPNITGVGHLCAVPRALAVQSVCGGLGNSDFENTRCILIWGANPTDTRHVNSGVKFVRVIEEAKTKGARLIVIDPRRTELAAIADEWIQIKVGTDLAFGLAMLNVIISETLYDSEFVENWTLGFPELKEHVRQFSPEWAEGITGVTANKIKEVARIYGTTKPATIYDGNGLEQQRNVFQTVRAIAMLQAITGNIDIPGAKVINPGVRLGRYLTVRPESKRLSAEQYPLFPLLPFPSVVDAILSGEPYSPRAMIVYHANPLLINSNEEKVREALEKLEFLVVSDVFLSATAQLADIVLPDTTEFEDFGFETYSSSKGGFVALREKVIEPIGESRPVFEVEYDLAKRMGLEGYYPWKNTEEWINYRLKSLEITLEEFKKQPILYVSLPAEYKKYLKNGFRTPSKKVEFYSQRLNNMGYDPLPVYKEPPENGSTGLDLHKYPLVGTTRKPGMYTHTKFRNMPSLRKLQPEPLAWINPADAQVRGICDGDEVTVESPAGSIIIEARTTEDIGPGLVVIDFGWGNSWDGGANVNILTPDDIRDPETCSTSNRRFLCEIKKT